MSDTVEIRTDNPITTASSASATPADARTLHAWPEELPEPDEPIVWAVMDSGIDEEQVETHPWFDSATLGKSFDATDAGGWAGTDHLGHGTGVASIIARHTPAVELWPIRIFGESGQATQGIIDVAYEWLLDYADEIDGVNMSWGAREDIPRINQHHQRLMAQGVHDVVSAGNTGSDGGSPSTTPKAFSAGAVNANGDLTRFSSRDPNQNNPDVAAIGRDVKMVRARDTAIGTPLSEAFVKASGTSFAAPHLSAAYINGLYQQRQSWDKPIMRAAPDIPGTNADGEGLLQLSPALEAEAPEPAAPSTDASVWSFAGSDSLFIEADWLDSGQTTATKIEETKDNVTIRIEK